MFPVKIIQRKQSEICIELICKLSNLAYTIVFPSNATEISMRTCIHLIGISDKFLLSFSFFIFFYFFSLFSYQILMCFIYTLFFFFCVYMSCSIVGFYCMIACAPTNSQDAELGVSHYTLIYLLTYYFTHLPHPANLSYRSMCMSI